MSESKQEASIPEQQRWADKAAAQHQVEIVRAFQDDGIAGDEIARRKGLQNLLAFCEERHKAGRPIEAIVAWDADRFSRANSFATAALLDQLMGHGVRRMLTNAEGLIDFEDDMQRVFFNLRQDLGKRAYAKSVSGAVSRTRADRARKGLWTGGPPPFGYVLGPDGRLALGDPAHVAAVRLLFREYLARDAGAYLLAEEMKAAGLPFPTYRGRTEWTDDLVYSILTDPQYTGDLYYNRTGVGKYHRTMADGRVVQHQAGKTRNGTPRVVKNRPEDFIVAEGAHPAVIDRATFEAVQRKLASRRQGGGQRNSDYPFSGLARCGDCGAPMYGLTVVKRDGDKRYSWRKYGCSSYMHAGGRRCHNNRVGEKDLLDNVAEILEERFADPSSLAELRAEVLARRRSHDRGAEKAARGLRRRIAGLDRQVAQGNRNLALAKSAKDFERVSAAIGEWEAERAGLAGELEALEEAVRAEEEEGAGLDEALALLQQVGAVIRGAKPERLRAVVRQLVEKVELRFDHQTLPSGRVRSIWAGGEIHLRWDLGCSVMPGVGSPTW